MHPRSKQNAAYRKRRLNDGASRLDVTVTSDQRVFLEGMKASSLSEAIRLIIDAYRGEHAISTDER